jgi:hypothetical protein
MKRLCPSGLSLLGDMDCWTWKFSSIYIQCLACGHPSDSMCAFPNSSVNTYMICPWVSLQISEHTGKLARYHYQFIIHNVMCVLRQLVVCNSFLFQMTRTCVFSVWSVMIPNNERVDHQLSEFTSIRLAYLLIKRRSRTMRTSYYCSDQWASMIRSERSHCHHVMSCYLRTWDYSNIMNQGCVPRHFGNSLCTRLFNGRWWHSQPQAPLHPPFYFLVDVATVIEGRTNNGYHSLRDLVYSCSLSSQYNRITSEQTYLFFR